MIDTEFGAGGRLYADAVSGGVELPEPDISDLWSPPAVSAQDDPKSPRWSGWRPNWTEFWSNAAELTGIGSISAGFWLMSPSFGLISAGLGLLVVGVAAGRPQ